MIWPISTIRLCTTSTYLKRQRTIRKLSTFRFCSFPPLQDINLCMFRSESSSLECPFKRHFNIFLHSLPQRRPSTTLLPLIIKSIGYGFQSSTSTQPLYENYYSNLLLLLSGTPESNKISFLLLLIWWISLTECNLPWQRPSGRLVIDISSLLWTILTTVQTSIWSCMVMVENWGSLWIMKEHWVIVTMTIKKKKKSCMERQILRIHVDALIMSLPLITLFITCKTLQSSLNKLIRKRRIIAVIYPLSFCLLYVPFRNSKE